MDLLLNDLPVIPQSSFPQELAEALRCNRTLEELCLHEGPITDVGAKVLSRQVASGATGGGIALDKCLGQKLVTLKYAKYECHPNRKSTNFGWDLERSGVDIYRDAFLFATPFCIYSVSSSSVPSRMSTTLRYSYMVPGNQERAPRHQSLQF